MTSMTFVDNRENENTSGIFLIIETNLVEKIWKNDTIAFIMIRTQLERIGRGFGDFILLENKKIIQIKK